MLGRSEPLNMQLAEMVSLEQKVSLSPFFLFVTPHFSHLSHPIRHTPFVTPHSSHPFRHIPSVPFITRHVFPCVTATYPQLCEQKVLQAGCSVRQLMLHQSAFGILSMLLICGANGSLISAFEMLVKDARLTAILLVWATTITLGTALVLQLVSEFSAVTAVTVTTLRKALTITASFVLFPKAMGWGHPVGATLVLASAFVKQGSAVQLASRWIDRHFGWMRSTQATAAAKAAHTSGKAHV